MPDQKTISNDKDKVSLKGSMGIPNPDEPEPNKNLIEHGKSGEDQEGSDLNRLHLRDCIELRSVPSVLLLLFSLFILNLPLLRVLTLLSKESAS